MHEGSLVYRAEERYHLTACGPALLEAVLARIKAAEEQLSTSKYTSLHLIITICHVSQYLVFGISPVRHHQHIRPHHQHKSLQWRGHRTFLLSPFYIAYSCMPC